MSLREERERSLTEVGPKNGISESEARLTRKP
jgi:hypothetical protein